MSPSLSPSKPPVTVAVVLRALRAGANAVATRVRAAWTARRHRREVANLLVFDERALRDIGLTRGDILVCLAGPTFDDPSTRLRILAVERRAGRRAQLAEWSSEIAAASRPAETTPLGA